MGKAGYHTKDVAVKSSIKTVQSIDYTGNDHWAPDQFPTSMRANGHLYHLYYRRTI